MASGTLSFHYFILSLLAQQPMSGYDIKQFLQALGWMIGNPSFGAIYPALHSLSENNLASVQVESRADKPMRKVYTITQQGRETLRKWASQTASADASETPKSSVMQLFLVADFSEAGLVSHLQKRRVRVAEHCSMLEQMVQNLGTQSNHGQCLAIEYGLAMANTELQWLDLTLERLAVHSEMG
ncbi:MAG: PadR family transcriptional regulator [Anaerolineae bacterium]|nr:PadR family transcriptional regulator [Anaerolineae bacterium]